MCASACHAMPMVDGVGGSVSGRKKSKSQISSHTHNPTTKSYYKGSSAAGSLPRFSIYGVRSRRTHSLGDQLDRADAGSWQIADGSATPKAAARGTSVGDFRVRFVVEP